MSTPQSKQQTANNGVAVCLHCCERKRKITRNFCDTCEAKGEAMRFREHVAESLAMVKSKAPAARQTDGGKHIRYSDIDVLDYGLFRHQGKVYSTPAMINRQNGFFVLKHGTKNYSPLKHKSIDNLIDFVCQEIGKKRPILPLDLIDANDFTVIERTKNHRLCVIGGREIKLPTAAIPVYQKPKSRRKILIRIVLSFGRKKSHLDYATTERSIR